MRLVFLNPHIDDFLGCPLHFMLVGRRPLAKYKGILTGEVQQNGQFLAVVNGQTSCFVPHLIVGRLPLFVRQWIALLEFHLWASLNSLSRKVQVIDLETVQRDHVLFGFSYKSAVNDFWITKDTCARFSRVIFHLSHYFIWTERKAQNLIQIPNIQLAGDSDLSENAYFRAFFGWYHERFLVLPFGVSSRFTNHGTAREEKCVASGTFHDLIKEEPSEAYADFIRVAGENSYQPVRREIYQSRDRIRKHITCLTSPFRSEHKRSMFVRIFKKLDVRQASYFRVDLVEEYNRHKYAVVGEEISGFPALGSFEAMLSGAVLFGQKSHLQGLGLVPGRHFIDYDGTLNDLLVKMQIYAGQDLTSISQAGEALIRANYSAESLHATWLKALSK